MAPFVSRLAGIVACASSLFFFQSVAASAQVVSLDPNYSVSLLAHGLQLPDGGMIFRPATNDLLITEENLGQIVSVNAVTGVISPFADVTSLVRPNRGAYLYELNVNSSGDVFAPGFDQGPVFRFDSGGHLLGSFSTPGQPFAVAFDSQDNFYVEIGSGDIYRYEKGSYSSPTLYARGFASVQSIRFNASDQLIVADAGAGKVYRVTPGGVTASSHTLLATLPGPYGIAIDNQTQNVFVLNGGNGTLSRITAPGVFSTFATGISAGSPAVGVDDRGNLYVADKFVGVVWKFTRQIASTTLKVFPDHGGNAGTVTVNISGAGFQNGATVKLTGLGGDIIGSSLAVADGSNLTARFDLSGTSAGTRNLVVTNPDGTIASLANGFMVEEGGAPNVSVDIVGLDKIRFGRAQTYYLVINNTGNVDGDAEFVSLSVPSTISTDQTASVDLFSLGSSSDPAFAIPSPDHANDNNLVFVTAGLPAGGMQFVPINLTVPLGVASFTMIASDPVLTSISFETYAGSQGVPFIRFHNCAQCNAANLPFAEALAASDAQDALRKYQNDLSAAQKEAAAILAGIGAVVAKAAIVQLATKALDLTPAQQVVLGLEIAAGAALLRHSFFDSSLDTDGLLSDFKNKSIAASISLAAKKANTKVASFLGVMDLSVAAINATISFNRAAATLKTDLNDFDLRFLLYKVAWQNYKDCLQQSCNIVINPGPPPCLPGTTCVPVTPVGSLDPNDKVGSQGGGPQHYVSGRLPYIIQFSNETTASAPAQQVSITDQLDITKDDLTTFSLGPISFGSQLVSPPPFAQTLARTVDLRPAQNLLVVINAQLNSATGLLTWKFKSLDPATGLPPSDPTAGFLPPGGEGGVFFTVSPKGGLATDTQILNRASIVFDVNPAIATPTWTNTLDSTPPASHVLALPATASSTSLTVYWTGTDVGAGVQDFTIYVSDNGGPVSALLSNVTATSATFTGHEGHTYAFYSIARDLVGNVEGGKTVAEATTQVALGDTTPPILIQNISGTLGNNGWYIGNVTVTWNMSDLESGIASSSGCNPTTLSADTAGVTLTCRATNGAGLTSSVPTTIKIDKTPPTITGSRTPGPNAAGWNNTPVAVSFLCSDALSGLAAGSPPHPTVLSTEGGRQSVSGTCRDIAGNAASVTVAAINIDLTPPSLTSLLAPTPNANGFNNSPVTVTFAATDGLSGVATVTAPVIVNTEGARQAIVGSASDRAGNTSSARAMVNLDKTPPEGYFQFDPVLQDIAFFGRDQLSGTAPGPIAPVSVAPLRAGHHPKGYHGDDWDRDDERATSTFELRTYKALDLAGNSITVAAEVKRGGRELAVSVVSLSYGSGLAVTVPPNSERYNWDIDRGALTELDQAIRLGRGEEARRTEADFNARRNRTTIQQDEPEPKTRLVKQGLTLMRLTTVAGSLSIEY